MVEPGAVDYREVVPMGFSVSGAAAIIFASLFIAFGMWYTAADNSFTQITDAQDDKTELSLAQANTEIAITSATFDTETDRLTVEVNNTGASSLSLNATSLVVDGDLVTDWQADATVEADGSTDLWLADETLTIELTFPDTQPDRVRIVTETGVASSTTVSEA